MFSLQQNWRTRGQNSFCVEERKVQGKRRGGRHRGEVAQTVYAHMNKCKNSEKNIKKKRSEA
jgi:hypothetical protein